MTRVALDCQASAGGRGEKSREFERVNSCVSVVCVLRSSCQGAVGFVTMGYVGSFACRAARTALTFEAKPH
jgi:hypothetical protein